MHSDPIADLLTRIRNGVKAFHESVTVPYSKIKEEILKILKTKGFIEDYKMVKDGNHQAIEVMLKESKGEFTLKRVSKPGQRIYLKHQELKPVKRGMGFHILSTSKGLMTNSEAYRQNLGGEIICEVY